MFNNNKEFVTKIYSLREKFDFESLKIKLDELKEKYSFLNDSC